MAESSVEKRRRRCDIKTNYILKAAKNRAFGIQKMPVTEKQRQQLSDGLRLINNHIFPESGFYDHGNREDVLTKLIILSGKAYREVAPDAADVLGSSSSDVEQEDQPGPIPMVLGELTDERRRDLNAVLRLALQNILGVPYERLIGGTWVKTPQLWLQAVAVRQATGDAVNRVWI